jgi:hypothetical protein
MSEFTTEHDLKSYNDSAEGVSYTPGTAWCGHDCHLTEKYGFVPEADCPIHDNNGSREHRIFNRAYLKCKKEWRKYLK